MIAVVALAIYSAVTVLACRWATAETRRALRKMIDLNRRLLDQVERDRATMSGLGGAAETLGRIVEEAKKRAGE